MGRAGKKTKCDSPDLAVDEKPSKGKAPIKISKPGVVAAKSDSVLPDKILQAALESGEIDTARVEEAKKALAEGKLDNPQALRRAAERMLDSGL